MHEGYEAPLLLRDDRIGNADVRIEHRLDVLGIDVLTPGTHDHILQTTFDVEPSVLVELPEVARAEPAVGRENLFRGLGIFEITHHGARRAGHDLALPGLGVDILQTQLHARSLGARRAETHHRGSGSGQQRRGLGQPVTDGIGHFGFEQEFLGSSVEFRPADAEEAQTASEELHKLLAGHAVEIAAQEPDAVERAPEARGVELGKHLMTVNLLDDQRHDQHHRGPDRTQRGHQRRGRGRTVEVDDPGAHREGIDHTDRTFVGVRQGQHREERVVTVYRENRRRDGDLRT